MQNNARCPLLPALHIENLTFHQIENILLLIDKFSEKNGCKEEGMYIQKFEKLLLIENHKELCEISEAMFANLMFTKGCVEQILVLKNQIHLLSQQYTNKLNLLTDELNNIKNENNVLQNKLQNIEMTDLFPFDDI